MSTYQTIPGGLTGETIPSKTTTDSVLYEISGTYDGSKITWKAPVASLYSSHTWSNNKTEQNQSNDKHSILITQQAVAIGGITNVYNADIDGRRLKGEHVWTIEGVRSTQTFTINGKIIPQSERLIGAVLPFTVNQTDITNIKAWTNSKLVEFKEPFKDAVHINVYKRTREVDYSCAIATANDASRANARFKDTAYATGVFWLNRDDPQFGGSTAPGVQLYVEGRPVRYFKEDGSLSTEKTYSANPAQVLLDYLLDSTYGQGLTTAEIDLETFREASVVCGQAVILDAPLEGALWTGRGGSRIVRRYECNLTLDSSKPIRDNINTILSTMNDPVLIWSAGQYKLRLDYPNVWGHTTIFKDSAGGTGVQPVYTIGQITQHSLWYTTDINGNEIPAAAGSGQEIVILARSTTDTVKSAPTKPTWDGSKYTIGAGWEDAVDVYITDNDLVRKGETVITWPDTTTRLNHATVRFLNETKDFKEDTVSWPDKIVKDGDLPLYETYLAEDSGVRLETEIDLTGVTSYYLAKAKAEHLVRSSRASITYSFSLNRDYLALEPGDIIKFQSDVLRIPVEIGQALDDRKRAVYGDLVKIREVKPNTDGTIKVTGTRYDSRNLAWNANDDEYVKPRVLFNNDLEQASNLRFVKDTARSKDSIGKIYWDNANDNRVTYYQLRVADRQTPTLLTQWEDIGTAVSGTAGFDIPNLKDGLFLVAVVACSNTKEAPKIRWPYLLISKSTARKVELTAPSGIVFVRNAGGVWTNPTLNLVATLTGFDDPDVYWYIDSVLFSDGQGNAVKSLALTVPHYDTVGEIHNYKVVVTEKANPQIVLDDSLTMFSADPSTGLRIGFDNDDITLTYDIDGVLLPSDQLPLQIRTYVINGIELLLNTTSLTKVVYSIENDYCEATIDTLTGIITVTKLVESEGTITVTAIAAGHIITDTIILKKTLDGESSAPKIVKILPDRMFFIQQRDTPAPVTEEIVIIDKSYGFLKPKRKWTVNGIPVRADKLDNGVYRVASLVAPFTATTEGVGELVTTDFLRIGFFATATPCNVRLDIDETNSTFTGYDTVALFSTKEATNSILFFADEETRVLPALWDGNLARPDDIPFLVGLNVYQGATEITTNPNVVLSIYDAWGIDAGNCSIVGDEVKIGNAPTDFLLSADSARVTVKALIKKEQFGGTEDLVLYTPVNVVKAKNGQPAYDAPGVNLKADSLVFIKLKNSAGYSPDYITLTAEIFNFDLTKPVTYAWESNGQPVPATAGLPDSQRRISPVDASTPYRVTVSGTSKMNLPINSLTDTISLYGLEEGNDTVDVALSNSSVQVPCKADGTVYSTTYEKIAFVAARGIALLPPTDVTTSFDNVKFSRGTGVDNNKILFSGFDTGDTQESCNILFTVAGTTLTKALTFIKVRDGDVGDSAPLVTVSSTSAGFNKDTNGNISPASNTLTATVKNIPNPAYSWTISGSSVVIGTAKDLTVTKEQFATSAGTNRFVTYRCDVVDGGVSAYDMMSQYLLIDGDDSIIVALSNEDQSIACNAEGVVSNQNLIVSTRLFVAKGHTLLHEGVNTDAGGVSVTFKSTIAVSLIPASDPDPSGVYEFTVGDMLDDSVTIPITATITYKGVTADYTKELTLHKNRDGKGAVYVDVMFKRGTTVTVSTTVGAATPGDGWLGEPPVVPANTVGSPLWMSKATKDANGNTLGKWSVAVRLEGAGLETLYSTTNTSYATSPSSWHSTFTDGDIYMIQKVGTGAWTTPIRIVGEKGEPGTPAGYVTISSSNGLAFYRTYAGTFSGSIVLTASPSSTATSYAWYKNGVSIGSSSQITVNATDMAGAGSNSYRVDCTVAGRVYSDTASVIWVVGGQNGVDAVYGYLTNGNATIPMDSAGNVKSGGLAQGSGNFKMFKGSSEKTSESTFAVTAESSCDVNINSTGGYSLASISSAAATATMTGKYDGVTVTQVLTLSAIKDGSITTTTVYAPRRASGFVYKTASSTDTPAPPSAQSYNFATGAFTSLTSGWDTKITATAGGKYWASLYQVTEDVSNNTGAGTGAPSFSAAFTHTNFDGVVTFTNGVMNAGSTTINGDAIRSGTITGATLIAEGPSSAPGMVAVKHPSYSNPALVAWPYNISFSVPIPGGGTIPINIGNVLTLNSAYSACPYALSVNGASYFSGNVTIANGNLTLSTGTISGSIDADKLDGKHASEFATSGHNHDTRYPHLWVCDSGSAYAENGMNINWLPAGGRTRGLNNQIVFEATSDARIKQDITPETLGLEFINALLPVSYRLIARPNLKYHGFIAQDVQPLIATNDDSLFQTYDDGVLGVDYMSIISPLVKAVQELTLRVKELEQKLDSI